MNRDRNEPQSAEASQQGASRVPAAGAGMRRTWFFRIAMAMAAIVFSLLLLEGCFRLVSTLLSERSERDALLGWRLTAHVAKKKNGLRSDGKAYPIEIVQREHGFRLWEAPRTDRKRLLVIGDSFTEAVQVSNDKTYYALLQQHLGDKWQVFSYGMGGYGTLQEFLVMDRHWDEIRPDAIIWQWCSNDFCNNLFAWENRSKENYQIIPRPYLENGQIVLRCPNEVPLLSFHSRLYPWLWIRFYSRFHRPAKAEVDLPRADSPLFLQAVHVTSEILDLSRKRLAGIPVFVFVAGDDEPQKSAFRQLAQQHGFILLEGVNEQLKKKEAEGVFVWAHATIGGHWSEEGHAVVAESLHKQLEPYLEHGTALPGLQGVSETPK